MKYEYSMTLIPTLVVTFYTYFRPDTYNLFIYTVY